MFNNGVVVLSVPVLGNVAMRGPNTKCQATTTGSLRCQGMLRHPVGVVRPGRNNGSAELDARGFATDNCECCERVETPRNMRNPPGVDAVCFCPSCRFNQIFDRGTMDTGFGNEETDTHVRVRLLRAIRALA